MNSRCKLSSENTQIHPFSRPVGKLYNRQDVEELAAHIRQVYPGFSPSIGMYTGTGFASFGGKIQDSVTIPYQEIPYYPGELQCPGHVGEFVMGRVGGKDIICACGKMFLLDGVPAQLIALPVRLFQALGCRTLIYTNNAGGINPSYHAGDFIFLTNHINLTGHNPLVGERNGEWGSMFFDMTYPYDAGLRSLGEEVASRQGIHFREGVYAGLLGPSFETAAEIQMLSRMGADLVGMSTVIEVIAARQLGMKVLGIGFIANMAAGLTEALVENDDIQASAATGQEKFARLLTGIIEEL